MIVGVSRKNPSPVDPDALIVGEAVLMPRFLAQANVTLTSGVLRLSFFTAKKTELINTVQLTTTGTTAAGATPTLVRVGLWTIDSAGGGTPAAASANTTSAFANLSTRYPFSLTSPFSKVAGQRYAAGVLLVSGAAIPTVLGVNPASANTMFYDDPQMVGSISSLSDLPTTFSKATSQGGGVGAPQFHLIP